MRTRTAIVLALLGALSLGFEWEGRLARLEAELASGDASRRREVVRQLASHPAAAVREPLRRALADEDATVRLEAADVAGQLQLLETTPILVEWLDDPDVALREAATRALGRIGDAAHHARLVRALGDGDARVRRAAVGAVATLGGAEAVVPLLGRLDDDDPQVRVDAAVALGALRDGRATVPLIGRARDATPEVRAAVFAALGTLGDARGVTPLVQGLRDDHEDARLAAIGALGRLGTAAAIDALAERLEVEGPRAKRALVAALGAHGAHAEAGPRALEATVGALADPDTASIAAEALALLARRRATPGAVAPRDATAATTAAAAPPLAAPRESVLTALAAGLDRGVAPTAITRTLARLAEDGPIDAAGPALARAVDALDAARARLSPGARARESARGAEAPLLRALALAGGDAVLVRLLEALGDEDDARAAAALDALSAYFDRAPADGRAADPLIAALGRVPRERRADVVTLLGRVGARRAAPTLAPLLASADASLRLAAARALGALGDPTGAAQLARLLDDRDARVRFEAAVALARSPDPAVLAAIAARLSGTAPADRHALAVALGGMLATHRAAAGPETERAAPLAALLRAARSDDAGLSARALDALAVAADPGSLPGLLTLAREPAASRRTAALRALAAFADPRAVDALRAAIDDPALALTALGGLGEHGGASDAESLFDAATRARWPSSAAAAFALARLARRGALAGVPRAAEHLCALFGARDPYVRANAATALAALDAGACTSPAVDPRALLGPAHAEAVRVAAARWLGAAGAAGALPGADVTDALEGCAARDPSPDVARACAAPALPPRDDVADVVAYGPGGRTSRPGALLALRLADGSVLVARADANAHLRLARAPRGPLALEDPHEAPLDAR